MSKNQKLELTWYGKDDDLKIEPRILIENKELSNTSQDESTENMLIHGDNLLALKALEQKYAGMIKCIYIDPPYNTGAAFEHYDDNLEHSIWLNLMRQRLEILYNLLKDEGIIFIQIDDNEQAYLKVLCDEVFGRNNYLNTISVKVKNVAGASGGGEDRRLKKNVEYILVYTKNYDTFKWINNAYDYTELSELIENYRVNNISWKYTSVIYNAGEKKYISSTVDGDGNEIKIYQRLNPIFKSISQIMKEENLDEKTAYYKYIDKIYTTAMPQSSIRPRVLEKLQSLNHSNYDLISIEYIPKTGKNKGQVYEQFYKGDKLRLFAWLKDVVIKKGENYYKKDLQGTYWDGINLNNLTKEGSVNFPSGKKPEALIQRILDMTTQIGDLVLDSFLGSGTTCAVAHKMNRKWIGIEMGNHAYTHCKVRLDSVIKGEDNGGITADVKWKGGGGYKFYEIAPTLIKEDAFGQVIINPEYNAEMLSAAVAKHEGYFYEPDSQLFWKQSNNKGKSYLFVTTNHVTNQIIDSIKADMQDDEFVLIVCKSYDQSCVGNKNILIKKIPQSLLKNCEFGRDDYSLNIICPPEYEEEEDDE